MSRSILDQNGIISLADQKSCGEIIVSPMFMWEFFNNSNTKREKRLIQKLQGVSNYIFITFKSTTCEKREIEARNISSLDMIIDNENTQIIRRWLRSKNPVISQIRDILAPNFTPDNFINGMREHVQISWLPKLQHEFQGFRCHAQRQLTQRNFEEGNEGVSREICYRAIGTCFQILKMNAYSEEQAVQFLRRPSILFNRVYACSAMYMYRSTQAGKGFPIKKIANDAKDMDYLFLAHHVDYLISDDNFAKQIFTHLKKSHEILSNMETGLDSIDPAGS